jgi:hypothetical protein
MGEPARGLVELESRLKLNAKTKAQEDRRREVLEDFRTGESATRLREMKYGDPMRL